MFSGSGALIVAIRLVPFGFKRLSKFGCFVRSGFGSGYLDFVARRKREYRAKHYQIFLDYPTEFSLLLPNLIEGFFEPFGGDFLDDFKL